MDDSSTTEERTTMLDLGDNNETNYLGVYLPDLD
jgi:hypothetical protein